MPSKHDSDVPLFLTTYQPISIGRGGRGNIRSPSQPHEVQSLGRSYAVEEELANIPTLAHGKADEIVVVRLPLPWWLVLPYRCC